MEQLTKNQAVATSQEAVQNQNEPQLRDENAHNDKSVHGVLNPTYQAGLRRDAVQPDIEAERIKRDEIQNRVASNIGISQSTFSVKVLNLFSRSRRKTNKRKSKHSAMLRNKETRHRMFIGLLNTTRKLA